MTCMQCTHMTECKDDPFANDAKFCPNESAKYCIGFEPFTNADRIRAMSDEELAVILVEEKEYGVCHIPFFRCPGGKDFDEDQYEDALRYTLDWLKQPTEGDVNNV